MTQHTIEVEGLPEGWEAVAYRHPGDDDFVLLDNGRIGKTRILRPFIIVEKIQPRRIVLEETVEDNKRSGLGFLSQQFSSGITIYDAHKVWIEVKE